VWHDAAAAHSLVAYMAHQLIKLIIAAARKKHALDQRDTTGTVKDVTCGRCIAARMAVNSRHRSDSSEGSGGGSTCDEAASIIAAGLGAVCGLQ
jgi:hypothetical protein